MSLSPLCSLFSLLQADFLEQLKAAGQRAKPYVTLGQLGKGKFAMVYKAQLGEELFALKRVAVRAMARGVHCPAQATRLVDQRTADHTR